MEEEQEVDSDMQQNAPPALDLSLARSKKSAGQLAPPRKTERLPSARGRHPILARGYEKDGTWAENSPGTASSKRCAAASPSSPPPPVPVSLAGRCTSRAIHA